MLFIFWWETELWNPVFCKKMHLPEKGKLLLFTFNLKQQGRMISINILSKIISTLQIRNPRVHACRVKGVKHYNGNSSSGSDTSDSMKDIG